VGQIRDYARITLTGKVASSTWSVPGKYSIEWESEVQGLRIFLKPNARSMVLVFTS
jgi:hypothetical protein